jgi:integrase/recombinase XerD
VVERSLRAGQMTGPLAPHANQLRAELVHAGYSASTIRQRQCRVAELDRWLDTGGITADALTPDIVDDYVAGLREAGGWRQPRMETFIPVLDLLRRLGVTTVAPSPLPSGREVLLHQFSTYLLQERALSPDTAENYAVAAAAFLIGLGLNDAESVGSATAEQVIAFIAEQCPKRRVGAARMLLTGVRAFLRWLFWAGLSKTDLTAAVIGISARGRSSLPRALSTDDAVALLESCDRTSSTGRRDFAVLVLLTRMGLRAGEAAALRLDDLRWRTGEIMVHGKGGRTDVLPLPVDVGDALAAYLKDERPLRGYREVFLRVHAPIRGLTSAGVSEIVAASARRAKLPGVTAHRLRHTAATAMLRAGSSLAEVGQVLRHASAATTAIYATVDHRALRQLTQAWVGAAR